MASNISENHHRLHGIDFCRAVFMILGLFFHTGLIYGVGQDWRVVSNETSWLVACISDFIHMFRMEAFYLISGFFYILVFKKGRHGFAKDRVFRALLPLIFCGLLINPIMNYYSDNQEYDWGNVDYFIKGQWLGHLWFLGNLIVYFVVSLPLCKFIISSKAMNSSVLLLLFYLITPFLAIIGLAVAKFTFGGTFIFISFGALFYYYSYFILGCFCFRNKEIFLSILNPKYFILSFSIFVAFFLLSYLNVFSVDVVAKVFARMSTGGLVLSMISVLYFLGSRDSKIIRSFSDSSYTIYILHEPIIILFYVFIFEWLYFGAIQEYILMIFVVFLVSYLTHNFFVKDNRVMRFLFNGVLYSKRSR